MTPNVFRISFQKLIKKLRRRSDGILKGARWTTRSTKYPAPETHSGCPDCPANPSSSFRVGVQSKEFVTVSSVAHI